MKNLLREWELFGFADCSNAKRILLWRCKLNRHSKKAGNYFQHKPGPYKSWDDYPLEDDLGSMTFSHKLAGVRRQAE
jgi:hypothetical protein